VDRLVVLGPAVPVDGRREPAHRVRHLPGQHRRQPAPSRCSRQPGRGDRAPVLAGRSPAPDRPRLRRDFGPRPVRPSADLRTLGGLVPDRGAGRLRHLGPGERLRRPGRPSGPG
jgi:hypothetical protein